MKRTKEIIVGKYCPICPDCFNDTDNCIGASYANSDEEYLKHKNLWKDVYIKEHVHETN